MRRLLVFALAAGLLASCTQGGNGAFSEPSASPSAVPPAALDLASLARLRDQLASTLVAHTSAGHLEASWGGGTGVTLAGPYRNLPAYLDTADLLAARQLLAPGSGGAGLQAAVPQLSASAAAEIHDLNGPNGGAYLLLARLGTGAASCPTPGPGPDPTCLGPAYTDSLKTAWYAPDTKSFFHVGDASTVYRPVDAIAVGAALVVAGYNEHSDDKINAGSDIIGKEMSSDFDQHFSLPYGLMTADARGGRQPTDTNSRLADAAGIAEVLLQAFDASREQQYLADARTVLQPLLDDHAGLRTASGFVNGIDLKGSAVAPGTPVDFEATVLGLQASRHYDRDDGGRFARLEEAAAQALLAAAAAVDPGQGLPATLTGTAPSSRSGLVTALGVVAICDVIASPPGATPPAPAVPSLAPGSVPP
jgi:hypothetical protein